MIERVQGGNWFADAKDGTPLGAFPTAALARAAIKAHENGEEIVGRIKPTIIMGWQRPGGM